MTAKTIVFGTCADRSGIIQYLSEELQELPAGGARVERRTSLAHEPASSYASTHPAPMPLRFRHEEEIGQVIALRRAHSNLYCLAETDLTPDELAALAGAAGLRLSPATRGGEPLRITEISLTDSPATVGLPPVKWWREGARGARHGALPDWVSSELDRASSREHRSRGELRIHEVGLDAAGEYQQVGRELQLLGGEHRYKPAVPVELRHATLAGVDFPQRTIEVVAVPYGQEAIIEYKGETWRESFERGAFNGVEKQPDRVKANRDHDKTRLVGKAVNFWPDRAEGLVGAIRIAKTPLGDETLALASEDMLGASVGFGARGSDQTFNHSTRRRTIRRGFLDHLAFVPDSAYLDARVLGVRSQ